MNFKKSVKPSLARFLASILNIFCWQTEEAIKTPHHPLTCKLAYEAQIYFLDHQKRKAASLSLIDSKTIKQSILSFAFIAG